jgi:glycosyltransferase involved in cell wall biosynthesis
MSTTLTVVTPSYNQARFLDETLRSVLCQRDQVHEYFVLDGGSTDGSPDVVRRYVDRIDYFVSGRDKGQSDAIHRGFSRATGDILCWLNSDDVFLPGALKRVREAFDRHPEWDALTGYHVQIDADSRIKTVHRVPGESETASRWGVLHVCQQTCFFRRKAYEKVGGLNLDLHCVMDSDLWLRMLKQGTTWGHVPEFLAAFRVHADAKGSSWLKQYAEEYQFLYRTYPEHCAPSLKHGLGRAAFRATQVLSGRKIRSALETRRQRGRKLTDVYGDWTVPSQTVADRTVPA